MSRTHVGLFLGCLALAACPAVHYLTRIPDLPLSEAARIIAGTPEFNRLARLLNVQSVDHMKDSMDSVSYGNFTLAYLNSPPDSPPINGRAEFRYIQGKWYLNFFFYGSPPHIQSVDVSDGPGKQRDTSN
jgi:hypothetical protein